MNAKSVFAVVAAALVGASSAYAIEATQLEVPAPSTLSRAQVELGLLDAKSDAVVSYGEATEFAIGEGSGRNREDVRAEARTAPSHSGMEDCPYVGG